jgi:hypothetical protein
MGDPREANRSPKHLPDQLAPNHDLQFKTLYDNSEELKSLVLSGRVPFIIRYTTTPSLYPTVVKKESLLYFCYVPPQLQEGEKIHYDNDVPESMDYQHVGKNGEVLGTLPKFSVSEYEAKAIQTLIEMHQRQQGQTQV